jgi:hypothetical protein
MGKHMNIPMEVNLSLLYRSYSGIGNRVNDKERTVVPRACACGQQPFVKSLASPRIQPHFSVPIERGN